MTDSIQRHITSITEAIQYLSISPPPNEIVRPSLKEFIRAKKESKFQQETLRRAAEEEQRRSSKWHLSEKDSEGHKH